MRWKKLYFLIYFKLGKFIENIFKNQILGQKCLKKKKKINRQNFPEQNQIFSFIKKNKLYFREIKFERKPKHCLIQKKNQFPFQFSKQTKVTKKQTKKKKIPFK